jgi:membrane-bound lytic murein transglycosylase MltF
LLAVTILGLFLPLGGSDAARLKPRHQQAGLSLGNRVAAYIAEAAQRFAVPTAWIHAVIGVESGGDRDAVSGKEAMGLMQIRPKTYAELRARYGFGRDPFDLHDNILAGTAYLREMHDLYGSPGFLAAYNAGPGRYEDHLTTGKPLPVETRAYVKRLASELGLADSSDAMTFAKIQPSAPHWNEAPVFVAQLEQVFTQLGSAFSAQPDRRQTARTVTDLTAVEASSNGLSARGPASETLFMRRTSAPFAPSQLTY